MANISISDLKLAGAGLFADSESFIGSMRDLSDNELNLTRGGGSKKGSGYGSGSKKGSGYGSGGYGSGGYGSCGCGYGC